MQLQDASLLCSKCYVGGVWTEADSKDSFPVINKTTGEVICTVPNCGKSETDHAIASAAEAFKAWGTMTGQERGVVLHRWHALIHKNIDDLALILTFEQGKPLAESKGEILLGCTYIVDPEKL